MSLNILNNVSLAQYTSWLVGGKADYFCMPSHIDEVIECQKWAQQNQIPITILGSGSNVLISDSGIEGLVLCMRKLSHLESEIKNDRMCITVLAGTSKTELLKFFLKHKLAPALFLAGLPGDVGGGIAMNAGVSENLVPREFMQLVDWVEVLDPNHMIIRLEKSQIKVSYRHTEGWQPHIILRAGLSWPFEPNSEILNQVKAANLNRLSKQPLDMPSCGSVFKNPLPHRAAQLIEQCGLKGYRCGDAQVSLKHSNFIVNLGQAKAQDIWLTIQHVQHVVLQKTQIYLTTEVVKLGRWPSS